MQTLLVTGPYPSKRQATISLYITKTLNTTTWQAGHPDYLEINPATAGLNSISIKQVKEVQQFLTLKPYLADSKVILIKEAEKLTLPAQNAFLKTLEEPPPHCLIILETVQKDLLLPTVLSRCQIVVTKADPTDFNPAAAGPNPISPIVNIRIGEKLLLAANYKSRDSALELVNTHLTFLRSCLYQQPSLKVVDNLKSAQKAYLYLKANVNPALVVGDLFLSYQ